MTLILMMQFDRALILTGLMEPALLRLNVCGESIETHFRTSFKTNARHTVGTGEISLPAPAAQQQSTVLSKTYLIMETT
jgi:hypothetical protein